MMGLFCPPIVTLVRLRLPPPFSAGFPPGLLTPKRQSGAAQLTLTERITVGDISFTASMNGTRSPAGFIVLNGTVTAGSFAGAQVHQRSNYVGGDPTASAWTGELQLMPASA
jgi:hypothetical protein